MGSHDVRDDLAQGFELADPPSPANAEPLRDRRPPPPRLCEQGPCRHYHRFEIQVDAEDPRLIRVPDSVPKTIPGVQETPRGLVYQPPSSFHREVHHYCYPSDGVDTNLGSLPVLACNRWCPKTPSQEMDEEHCQGKFRLSDEWAEYTRRLAEWTRAREQERRDADTVDQMVEAEADRVLEEYRRLHEGTSS